MHDPYLTSRILVCVDTVTPFRLISCLSFFMFRNIMESACN